jgi:hypothetical protein
VTINSSINRDNPNSVQTIKNALPSPAQSIGACCNGAGCVSQQAAQCAAVNQRFAGIGTVCNPAGVTGTPCCRADFDHNGAITLQDLFGFLNAWFAGSPQADANNSNSLTIQDIFDFLAAWFAGCP